MESVSFSVDGCLKEEVIVDLRRNLPGLVGMWVLNWTCSRKSVKCFFSELDRLLVEGGIIALEGRTSEENVLDFLNLTVILMLLKVSQYFKMLTSRL